MTTQSTRRGPKKKRPLAATIVMVVVLIAVVGGIVYLLNRRAKINEYNAIIEQYVDADPPRHEEAIAPLKAFMDQAPGDLAAEAKKTLARCYVALGDRTELSQEKSAEWFRKADELDPNSLNPSQRQLMNLPALTP